MATITCCHDCTERHKACHSDCKKYLAEKQEFEQFKTHIAEEKARHYANLRSICVLGATASIRKRKTNLKSVK